MRVSRNAFRHGREYDRDRAIVRQQLRGVQVKVYPPKHPDCADVPYPDRDKYWCVCTERTEVS